MFKQVKCQLVVLSPRRRVKRLKIDKIRPEPVNDGAPSESVLEGEGHVVDADAVDGGELLPEPCEQRVGADVAFPSGAFRGRGGVGAFVGFGGWAG